MTSIAAMSPTISLPGPMVAPSPTDLLVVAVRESDWCAVIALAQAELPHIGPRDAVRRDQMEMCLSFAVAMSRLEVVAQLMQRPCAPWSVPEWVGALEEQRKVQTAQGLPVGRPIHGVAEALNFCRAVEHGADVVHSVWGGNPSQAFKNLMSTQEGRSMFELLEQLKDDQKADANRMWTELDEGRPWNALEVMDSYRSRGIPPSMEMENYATLAKQAQRFESAVRRWKRYLRKPDVSKPAWTVLAAINEERCLQGSPPIVSEADAYKAVANLELDMIDQRLDAQSPTRQTLSFLREHLALKCRPEFVCEWQQKIEAAAAVAFPKSESPRRFFGSPVASLRAPSPTYFSAHRSAAGSLTSLSL